jgi:hypothetical protein
VSDPALSEVVPGLKEEMDAAAERMVQQAGFDDTGGNIGEFLFQARHGLARALDVPMSTLAQNRFTINHMGDGRCIWHDFDVVKGLSIAISSECNSLLGQIGLVDYLTKTESIINAEFVDGIIEDLHYRELSERLIRFFSFGSVEDILVILSRFTARMIHETGATDVPGSYELIKQALPVTIPGETMVSWFHKLKHCIANEDQPNIGAALNSFVDQFFPTAGYALENAQAFFTGEQQVFNEFSRQIFQCMNVINPPRDDSPADFFMG